MKKQNRNRIIAFYRAHLQRYPLFESGAYLLKYMLLPTIRGKKGQRYRAPTWRNNQVEKISRIALIADTMTLDNFKKLLGIEIVVIRPQDWRQQMETLHPQLLFCESTWHGSDGCWDYRIHRNKRLLFDNRRDLRKILRYCAAAKIPTVFWNKEDPTFFDDPVNSFSDTALLFEHVFTTCLESIPRYRALGKEANVMMFGFSPELFHPIPLVDGENRAVFFGGWYADQPERCENMRRIFAFVRQQGFELTIYDRYSGDDAEDNNRFPDEYRPYIRPAVPYYQICQELAHAAYVVNVSTVTDSETMFSRRVFEVMACGRVLISNDSVGLRKRFPGRVWFIGEDFDRAEYGRIAEENIREAFEKYTFEEQLIEALKKVGLRLNCQGSRMQRNSEEYERKQGASL